MARGPRKRALTERFWAKVHKGRRSSCWVWGGAVSNDGYGSVYAHGKTSRAHRVSWELAHGPIPDGLVIRHTCDNRRCVNPAHLLVGTHKDNYDDMILRHRDRRVRGESMPQSKLTAERVRDMRVRHASGESIARLAREFGVHPKSARNAILGVTWRHVAMHSSTQSESSGVTNWPLARKEEA